MARATGSLFDWPERQRIQAMELQRDQLRTRISGLRPRSFKRVELQARLRALTEEELRLLTQLDQDHGQ